MEPTLLRIARGLDGSTTSVFAIRDLLAAAIVDIQKSDRRTENRLADLQLAFDTFVGRVDDSVLALKIITGSAHDAKKALEDGRRAFDRAIDESRKLPRYNIEEEEGIEGPAPRGLQIFVRTYSVKLLNVVWPFAVKKAPSTLAKVVQYVGGSTLLAAIGKIIHFVYTHS